MYTIWKMEIKRKVFFFIYEKQFGWISICTYIVQSYSWWVLDIVGGNFRILKIVLIKQRYANFEALTVQLSEGTDQLLEI